MVAAVDLRQPFLWRAFRDRLSGSTLIDGRYLGYLLCSLWTDPSERRARVMVRSHEDGVRVQITLADRQSVAIEVAPPLALPRAPRQHRRRNRRPAGSSGHAGASAATLIVDGAATLRAQDLDVRATTIAIEGTLWLAADRALTDRRFEVRVREGARVGWGGALADRYPWNRHASTLDGPPHAPGSRP